MIDVDYEAATEPRAINFWVPVAYARGNEYDKVRVGLEYRGHPVANRRGAWSIARRMCEELADGVGFAVKRIDEIETRDAYVNITSIDTIGRADDETIGCHLAPFE